MRLEKGREIAALHLLSGRNRRDVNCVEREFVVMDAGAGWRACAAISGIAEIVFGLHRALRQTIAAAGALRQGGHGRRDVENEPVPESSSSPCIGIEQRECIAVRA